MITEFFKYHGTGNDFIIIDNRKGSFEPVMEMIYRLCHRRFGIGADGLMLLEPSSDANFRMRYYNSDGKEGSMCGNGGRCITAFARRIGLIENDAFIEAFDGRHHALIISETDAVTMVKLDMNDVNSIEQREGYFFLDTGSPHHVVFVNALKSLDVVSEGKKIRYGDKYKGVGTNVDFAEQIGDKLFVRTYERGVEDETLSCGTGVTAAAIAWSMINPGISNVLIDPPGGALSVSFRENAGRYSEVCLEGPAAFIYKGELDLI
jgi:diaminopimelate epimerase